jgi:uncharacterized membrane protein
VTAGELGERRQFSRNGIAGDSYSTNRIGDARCIRLMWHLIVGGPFGLPWVGVRIIRTLGFWRPASSNGKNMHVWPMLLIALMVILIAGISVLHGAGLLLESLSNHRGLD